MEWVETTGRSLEEAKDAALDQLGVDEAEAEFQILEEPKPGLFGRMRGEARVRARVSPSTPRAKDDRRDRRRRTRGKGDKGEHGGGAGSATASRAESRTPQARPTAPSAAADTADDIEDITSEEHGGVADDLTVQEQGDVARGFLEGLLDRFDLEAEVNVVTMEDDLIELAVNGADLGFLIGPRGTTLGALQELTRTAVQRRSESRTARIMVDVAGYREKRREALTRFTRQVADEVIASGERRSLEPMSAADRKVIHDTANDIEGVVTSSEGEEPRRRVVISPA
jgi:spoIIIJ-associated protein